MSVLDRNGLQQVIAGILVNNAGLSAGAVFWAIDSNPIVGDNDRAEVTMDVTRMSALGVDEHRSFLSTGTDGFPSGTYWTAELGNREIIITFKAKTFDQGVEAAELLDIIRTGIRAASVTVQLNALNLAYVWSTPAIRIPARVNERALNTAVADFEFAGIASMVSQIIPPGVGGDYIATVDTNNRVTGTLNP